MYIYYIVYHLDRFRMHAMSKIVNSRYRQSNIETPAQIILPIKHQDTGPDHVALHDLAHRCRSASHEDDLTISGTLIESSSWCNRPPLTTTATRMTKAKREKPTVRRRSKSRRDVDVCPLLYPVGISILFDLEL